MQGTEEQHAIALIEWCALQVHIWPELARILHIPNEGKRTKVSGGILKRMGLRPGVPDYFLPALRFYEGAFRAGLWIELKAPGGKVEPEQEEWLTYLGQHGYATAVCFGWVEARDLIVSYLGVGVSPSSELPGAQWRQ